MRRMLVLVAAATGLVLLPATGATTPATQQRCSYEVVYEGRVYSSGPIPHERPVRSGARVGRGLRLGCNDIVGRPERPTPVDVFRFGTASPHVALTTRELGFVARVAVEGRCFGFGGDPDGYLHCLQTEIRFRGRGYTGTHGPVLPRGERLGHGQIRGQLVPLQATQGIDPRVAVAREDDPQLIFVAHRRCQIWPYQRGVTTFTRCLRAPFWLAIRGHTRTRTATIQSPGSLHTNVRLRLFLAPDAIADQLISPEDERLISAGRLTVDRKGRGKTTIRIADALGVGRYAVLTELPGGQVRIVGVLALNA
jgi:hypothetical protein